jgi:outer membrane protein OmpA-like peptidoglycan-associated protein
MFRRQLMVFGIALAAAACQQSAQLASPPPPPVTTPAPKDWMVFFDLNSTKIDPDAAATITDAANVAKGMPNAKVTVTGYTDTTGSVAYNQALSMRRANAVRDGLIANGVPAQAINVVGSGEQSLLVQTADQVNQPKNRRVGILVSP